jgi:hypothetical protein
MVNAWMQVPVPVGGRFCGLSFGFGYFVFLFVSIYFEINYR